jgi:tetrahydromethanopterin S-methyltransferase subunit G
MKILERMIFIHKYRKELNENNPYTLKTQERIRLRIERSVMLKFSITIAAIVILIISLNLLYNILWENGVHVNLMGFPVSDENSARYFFSAVPQSLAALLAISFTVLLIYLQISTDRYSIQTVRYIFSGREAITVISIFMITILYSFFELGKIKDYSDSYPEVTTFPWDDAMLTIFILTVLCGIFLILFFYKTISGLIPKTFIRESGERIKKASIVTLDFTQLIRIKSGFFKNKIKDIENVEESYFPGGFSLSDSKHPVKTTKRGFVQDIDISKIAKCSKLLSSVSSNCKLQLNIPIERTVSSASNVLGFIECSNSEIIPKAERLVEKAYKIDNKKTWMLEDYNELEPISSLTTKAIKDFEKGVAETALRELTDTIVGYIKARKSFGLMPPFEEAEAIRWGRHFIDESFKHLEKIMEISIKESDPDIIDLLLYLNREIGEESISLQDLDTFKSVTGFYLYSSHRLEDDFIDTLLLYSRDLELKTIFDLEEEKETMDYTKGSEYVLKELADYYRNLTKILMDNRTRFATVSLGKLSGINNNLERLMYDNTQFQLRLKLEQLEPESNEYQEIKNKLEIIEEKERISKKLNFNIGSTFYSIGTWVMVNTEREKFTIEFSQPIFDKLVDFFKKNNLEEVFNRANRIDSFFLIEHWLREDEEDEEARIGYVDYIDRFHLLMTALLYRKGKDLKEIKPIERFNKNQLETFKKEFEKLKDNAPIWDQLFENESQKYFEETLKRLEECTGESEENLREKVRQARLSEERREKVKSDIIMHAKRHLEARKFINVEVVTGEDEKFIDFGINTFPDKITFVDETVDPTVYHGYDLIGASIGREIGIGESEYLTKQIFEKINIKDNRIQFETFSLQNLNTAKEKLEERGFKVNTILMSLDLGSDLWRMEEFSYSDRHSEEMPTPYGTIDGIEIYDSRKLPKEVAIIFDKTHIGTLEIRKELSPIITTDFDKKGIIKKELEEGKIMEEQREERLKELDERVNIKALEKINFEFGSPKAGLVLFIKSIESL